MISVSAVTLYASELLNDQKVGEEYVTWSQTFLKKAVVEGAAAICSANPKLFATTQVISTVPGTRQNLPEDVRERVRVLAATGIDGVDQFDFLEVSTDTLKRSLANCCRLGVNSLFAPDSGGVEGWILHEYAWDTDDADHLYVNPPVPADGHTYKITVSYVGKIVRGDDIDIHDRFHSALVDFTLHRAYGRDSTTQIHEQKAAAAYARFNAAIGVTKPQATGGQ